MEVKPDSVLLPIADIDTARDHIDLGVSIARDLESELILLHVINVPKQLPPSAATDFVEDARPMMDEAREYAEQYDVPVRTMIRVGHKPHQAIIHTAKDTDSEYLIMGWKGSVHEDDTVIGSNIDVVLKESNTNAIVMQRTSGNQPEDVLVPVANPNLAPLSIGVGTLLLGDNVHGTVTVLNLSEEPLNEEEKQEFKDMIREQAIEDEEDPASLFSEDSPIEFEFDESNNVIEDIGRRSSDYDRVVLGTSQEGFFQRKVFGKIPTEIAQKSKVPVVFVRPKATNVRYEVQHFFQFFRELEEQGEPDETVNNGNTGNDGN
jgi:nucleotide-binding universal stress UspA family protein